MKFVLKLKEPGGMTQRTAASSRRAMKDIATLQKPAHKRSAGSRSGSVKLTAVSQTCVTQVLSRHHMPFSLEYSCALRWKPYLLSRKAFIGQSTGEKV